MNTLQPNSCAYIDYKTPMNKRKEIVKKYKSGELPFLINVRILVEGFDAPITNGVCFLHLPFNMVALIQIIGRALRLYAGKTFANIILPFSTVDDEKGICNFLRIMAKNDSRIRASYNSKKLGGYISIYNNNIDEKMDEVDAEYKYDIVYDSMLGIKNRLDIWLTNFNNLKQYINKYNKTPNIHDKNRDTSLLGSWFVNQKQNFKHKPKFMTNIHIYNIWSEFICSGKYSQYFLTDSDRWIINFQEMKDYINKYKKLPSQYDKNKNIKTLAIWICAQKTNYKLKKCILSNPEFYNMWYNYINDNTYKNYFYTNIEIWHNKLHNAKIYIDTHSKLPSPIDKDKTIAEIGIWIGTQKKNFINKIDIMHNEEIYNVWLNFTNSEKYSKYFLTATNIWKINFQIMKDYINKYNKLPTRYDKNKVIQKLGEWIHAQKMNFANNINIMHNENIRNIWSTFINSEKYKQYFLTSSDIWEIKFREMKEYIDKYNKLPSQYDNNEITKTLGLWVRTQKMNYKLKQYILAIEPEFYNMWHDCINSDLYKKYFYI